MNLTITPKSTLQEIKTLFHQNFTGLKIEFFIDANQDGNLTSNEQLKDYSQTIESIGSKSAVGQISIAESSTVAEVETSFSELFGVTVQVFRKSGNSWLMTTTSDNSTLSKLNALALESTIPPATEDPIDASDRMELE